MSDDKVFESSRKRSPNFTKRENRVLVDLIQRYEPQIEIKKTDHASNVKKSRAWQELAKDFNMLLGGSPYRSATVLKHRYENIKKEARRTLKMRKTRSSTSNGVKSTTPEVSPEDGHNSDEENLENGESDSGPDLKEYIRIKLLTEEDNEQDQESEVDGTLEEEKVDVVDFSAQPKIEIEHFDESSVWQGSPPPYVQSDELQKKCLLEQHKLKVQQMKEKHALEMDLIKQQHKEMIRMMRKEHDSKMEFLELEKTVAIINKI